MLVNQLANKARSILENGEANKIGGAIIQVCDSLDRDQIIQLYTEKGDTDDLNYLENCELHTARQMAYGVINAHIIRSTRRR